MPKRNVLWMYDILVERRAELQKYLEENGIETRKFFKPMSQQPMYFNPNFEILRANYFSKHGLYLPTYEDLTKQDQEEIVNKIKEFYER